MENRQRKKKQKKKRINFEISIPPEANLQTSFALMVAALRAADNTEADVEDKKKKKKKKYLQKSNSFNHQLQIQILNQLRHSLLSKTHSSSSSSSSSSSRNLKIVSPQLALPIPILSLLPVLFNSKCAEIVSACAEFVGAASLFSLEMNEQLASDDKTVHGLISVFQVSKSRKTLIAACNAVLDMSTTSIGRQRLLEFSALENLILCFLQVLTSSTPLVFLLSGEKVSEDRLRIGFKEDELPILLLDAAVALINASKIDQLEKIPNKLSETLLAYLKKLWTKVRSQMVSGTILKYSEERHFCVSNIRANNLAESIFRLSIYADQLTSPFHMNVISGSIFSRDGSNFEHFVLNHWEASPLLIRRLSKVLNEQSDIFSSFKQSFKFDESVASFLSIMLKDLISCPPIASDELDILRFLKEVGSHLGFPMIYQQDIRVLKAHNLEGERHFFQEHSSSHCFQDPKFLYIDDILRCEEAYKEGYTIALRGLEFHFGSIAAIVDGLNHLFGQPSAGVNMYLTPPNSQGLACHSDDHCVLVCQLLGVKQWRVFPESSILLPRLYQPIDREHGTDSSTLEGCRQFSLREGDILYIPRGFPHEACTIADTDRPNETAQFSLHLTLSIEVEPPFEWEGFAHVALHRWYQSWKRSKFRSSDLLSESLNAMSVNLLHVVIKLIGDSDPTFRKACLVGAISLLSGSSWLDLNQRTIFNHLIERIDAKSRFSDALGSVALSFQQNKDPLEQIKWLRHLGDEEEGAMTMELYKWKIPPIESERHFILFCEQHREKAETAFMQVKSEFCSEVVFEDVEQCYNVLLDKYRKVRKRYMNGMLSLHCI